MTDAACLGAALLAGVGAGVYADVSEAVEQAVHWRERVTPEPAGVTAYDARYPLYCELHPLLANLLHRL